MNIWQKERREKGGASFVNVGVSVCEWWEETKARGLHYLGSLLENPFLWRWGGRKQFVFDFRFKLFFSKPKIIRILRR